MGLGISAVMDIFIAGGLSYYLRQNKSGFSTCVPALRRSFVAGG